ncbi:MAG TPA: NAD-dependent epimerase/dehydratase family protein [Thermoanaerobaculia bacterium]|nr:NAD-dependent epimerase/dehydratase family protein [Thermoanaerobaculia bacterium]
MRALITGITGFLGSHLAEALTSAGAEISGITRGGRPVRGHARIYTGALADAAFVRDTLRAVKPTHVFHCAGATNGDKAAMYEINVAATAALFETIEASPEQPVVVVVGSSAAYGEPAHLPLREDDPLHPITDYGRSKAKQEEIALAVYRRSGLPMIRTRMFNLVGPWQPDSLVTSDFAKQIVRAERGGDRVVRVGNLASRRDYVDVRDAALALMRVAEEGVSGEVYNVCSGHPSAISEVLDVLLRYAAVAIQVEHAAARYRAADVDEQYGTFERLRAATGWSPRISLERSLADLLDSWRSRSEGDFQTE